MAWSAHDGWVVMRATGEPALRWDEFTAVLFELAEHGLTDHAVLPQDAELMALLARYPEVIAPSEPIR